jgi:hypothetical protein
MSAAAAKSVTLPIRIRAVLERLMLGRLHGAVTLTFSDGAISDVEIKQRMRSRDLPPPVLIEPDKGADEPAAE